MVLKGKIDTQICCDCHRRLNINCFHIHDTYESRRNFGNQPIPKTYHKPYCIRCGEIRRIKETKDNPYDQKIRATVSYHARRHGFTKINGSVPAFFRAYNLSYEFFRDLLIAALKADWCPVCEHTFSEFIGGKKGYGVLHLDKIYRDKSPTSGNWRWIHEWDNKSKGRKPAETFDQQNTVWNTQCELAMAMANSSSRLSVRKSNNEDVTAGRAIARINIPRNTTAIFIYQAPLSNVNWVLSFVEASTCGISNSQEAIANSH